MVIDSHKTKEKIRKDLDFQFSHNYKNLKTDINDNHIEN